jgi:Ca2+-binding EF-hand superfamily protein
MLSAEELFDQIFKDPSLNKISASFFKFKVEAYFYQLGLQKHLTNENEITDFFKKCDENCDLFITISDFSKHILKYCESKMNDVRKVFNYLDDDYDGFLDF